MRPKSLEKEDAIRSVALQIIADEGLENLSMQKLAKAANISPRTIYLKYENKEDFLIKLFVEDVLGAYEAALMKDFDETADFAAGVKHLWISAFHYFKDHREAFALMQYGKASPLLNKAFQDSNIKQGQYFAPIHRFLKRHVTEGVIKKFPFEVHRSLLFAPMFDMMNEYFEHLDRPKQIITEKVITDSCDVIIKGILK